MNAFEIVVDASCDLDSSLRKKYGIADKYIKGLLVYPDGHEEIPDMEWENCTPEEFFGKMNNKKNLLKTAMPRVADMEDILGEHAAAGRDVLCIMISSGISGAYNGCCNAAKNVMSRYPGINIRCVDSKRYSCGEGLLAILASKYRDEGKTLDETAQLLEDNKNRIHQIGWLDDLFFCNRVGRVSGISAVMGTFVGIKPLADFGYDNGLSTVIGKVRGYKASYDTIIKYIENTITEPEKQTIFVTHSVRGEYAQKLKELIEENIRPSEIIMTTVGQTCGTSIGPGLVCAFYFGNPVSKDNAEEKALITKLAGKA